MVTVMIRFPVEEGDVCLLVRAGLEPTQVNIEWAGRPLSLGTKRPDLEAHHSSHTITMLRKSKVMHSHPTVPS